MKRLPWQRAVDGSFAAYPNGATFPRQRAHVWLSYPPANEPQRAPEWRWLVEWDVRFTERGNAASKQAAADAATAAWWSGIALALDRERTQEPFRLFLERLHGEGRADWHLFDIEAAPYDALMHVMAECQRNRDGDRHDAITAVIARLSTEFYRRRLAGSVESQRAARTWDVTG
jgi:hypothetical protein